MILKYPISIPDFLSTCKEMEHKPCFELVLSDLLYEHGVLQPEPFGLQGIRKVIEVYEQSLSVGKSSNKKEMPFFREHQLRLIGPELVPFACSLYEESTSFTPAQNDLWISLDSEDLIDLCLGENLSLVCCKYDENEMLETFEPLLKQEYDKILFDEENTGFLPDSRFVSLLYKALFEWRPAVEQPRKEWRITSLNTPEEADYRWNGTTLKPMKAIQVPASYIRQIEIYPDYQQEPALYTALIGALKKVGLVPELLLTGLVE